METPKTRKEGDGWIIVTGPDDPREAHRREIERRLTQEPPAQTASIIRLPMPERR